MSETKHTAGPWNYDGADGEYVTPPNLDEPVICDLMPRDADCFTEEDEANGHLIAAAPDLLYYVRILAPTFHAYAHEGPVSFADCPDSLCKASREAIAKALSK